MYREKSVAGIDKIVEEALRDIRLGRIKGSTEVVEYYLKILSNIVNLANIPMNMLLKAIIEFSEKVLVARPANVMLANTIRVIMKKLLEIDIKKIEDLREAILSEGNRLLSNYLEARDRAARIAASRIKSSDTIMTFSYSTTVLKSIEYAVELGKNIKVIVAESRPRSEGVYTASKLDELGVETMLIVDSAMNYYMRIVDKVLVGAEAIAANGAVINKVGTSLLALIARSARVPFYVVAGTYKFSLETVFGELIELPMLSIEELGEAAGLAEKGVKAEVPLMDATDPRYIDAIITERGLIAPTAVPMMIMDLYGSWPPVEEPVANLIERVKTRL